MKILIGFLLAIIAVTTVACSSEPSSGSAEVQDGEKPTYTMERSSEGYCGSDYTLEALEAHFRELGFEKFEEYPVAPDDDNYMNNILELSIQTGFFSTGGWEAGDTFDSDDTIKIYYNESPMLIVDTCPDFAYQLEGSSLYESFASEYDGRYISFDAYVSYQLSSEITLDSIINVSGENYEYNQMNGIDIRIGDRTYGVELNMGLPVGTRVHVEGRIDLDWTEYYDQLYIEGLKLYAI